MTRRVERPSVEVQEDASSDTRVGKRDFLRAVAARAEVPVTVTERVYDAMLEVIIEFVRDNGKLVLTGFGRFYRQIHRGHRVQFANSEERIPDYPVLKFSATRRSNERLGGVVNEDDDDEDA